MISTQHSVPRDPDASPSTSNLSLPTSNLPSQPSIPDTQTSASATIAKVIAPSSSNNGFDLINSAIRMGSSTGTALSAVAAGSSISRVSSTSSTMGPTGLQSAHSHASDIAAAASAQQQHADLVRKQLGSGGIIAALQRKHPQPSGLTLSEVPLSVQRQLRIASYMGAKAGAQVAGTIPGPVSALARANQLVQPAASPTSVNETEQTARQLNPNAFQFPWKLHDMLDRSAKESNEDIVSWVDDGNAFRVHMPDVFVDTVMPRFFKQTKYKSFQRQLNLYGFTRLHNGPNKGGYKHKYFRRGQPTLCQLITRCPLRDSSSAAARAAALANQREMLEDINLLNAGLNLRSLTPPSLALAHGASGVPISSNPSTSLLQNQPPTTALIAAHQRKERLEALSSRFQIMEKARQEQQLHQLQAQQFDAHRIQHLNLLQPSKHEIPLASTYAPGMPLAGTDHSTYPSTTSLQLSATRPPTINLLTETTAEYPQKVLDSSKSGVVSLTSPKPTPHLDGSSTDDNSSLPRESMFPWKLYEMLEHAEKGNFAHIVSWLPGTSCFKVHDNEAFVETVMPRFFKQTKYKSFQRQLNLYGFSRGGSGATKGSYHHPSLVKGRKELLALINRVKIKGTGRPRALKFTGTNAITDTDSSDNLNESNPTSTPTPEVTSLEQSSGIDVILEAIQAKEKKEKNNHDAVGSRSDDSNTTIPSTIDVKKESLDTKELSWRQNPSESFSDWTIEVIEEDKANPGATSERAVYHVHRRVLAVGPKKSEYFAKIFKSNSSANRTELRLTKRQAAVFPIALDYIYADIDFDLEPEKAYALYSLGERLQNSSIIQTVTDFISKWCMTKDTVVDFLKLGQCFQNKTLLENAVLKCSQEIWNIDVALAEKIDPMLLLRVLMIATTVAQNRTTADFDSLKLSQMVAASVSAATTSTLTLEIFQSLTGSLILPSIDPIAAIKLLATENTLISAGGSHTLAVDSSFHERCVSSILGNWEMVRKKLSEDTVLSNAMKSVSSMVLFDLLMSKTSPPADPVSSSKTSPPADPVNTSPSADPVSSSAPI